MYIYIYIYIYVYIYNVNVIIRSSHCITVHECMLPQQYMAQILYCHMRY